MAIYDVSISIRRTDTHTHTHTGREKGEKQTLPAQPLQVLLCPDEARTAGTQASLGPRQGS